MSSGLCLALTWERTLAVLTDVRPAGSVCIYGVHTVHTMLGISGGSIRRLASGVLRLIKGGEMGLAPREEAQLPHAPSAHASPFRPSFPLRENWAQMPFFATEHLYRIRVGRLRAGVCKQSIPALLDLQRDGFFSALDQSVTCMICIDRRVQQTDHRGFALQ